MRFRSASVAACLLSLALSPLLAATPGPTTKATGAKPAATSLKTAKSGPATVAVTHLKPVRVVPAVDVLHDHSPVTVQGGVTGADGLPLPGATVWLTNTHQAVAVTNSAGDFTFTLPNNGPVSLSCGYGGYAEQTLVLGRPSAQEGVFFALSAATGRRKK